MSGVCHPTVRGYFLLFGCNALTDIYGNKYSMTHRFCFTGWHCKERKHKLSCQAIDMNGGPTSLSIPLLTVTTVQLHEDSRISTAWPGQVFHSFPHTFQRKPLNMSKRSAEVKTIDNMYL